MFNRLLAKTIVFLALVASFALDAQTDALLWKVSGKGLKKPSYIFGTIHLHCQADFINKLSFTDALKTSDVVAMELKLNDFDVITSIYKSNMEPAQKPLSTLLTKKEAALIDSVCRHVFSDSIQLYEQKTPMFLMMRMYMDQKISGCAQPTAIDLVVTDMAVKSDKEIFGLENFQYQDSLLKSIPDSVQVKWLVDLCKNIGKAKTDFASLTAAYNNQSSKELQSLMMDLSPDTEYFKDLLITDRNNSWVKFLKENMPNYGIFMAVGCGHLQGETGLITQLQKLGYTLTPITIK